MHAVLGSVSPRLNKRPETRHSAQNQKNYIMLYYIIIYIYIYIYIYTYIYIYVQHEAREAVFWLGGSFSAVLRSPAPRSRMAYAEPDIKKPKVC